jgi:protein ImuA
MQKNRTAMAEELRRLLPTMERIRVARTLPFGLAAIDQCLPQGGLACGALHEVIPETGATAAAFGFIVALLARLTASLPAHNNGLTSSTHTLRSDPSPERKAKTALPPRLLILVISTSGLRDCGRPYGRGLCAFGLDPNRVILVETAHRQEALWAMEEALRSRAPAAVAGVVDKLDLKVSQRLQLAATDGGLPLFLLRPAKILEGSAAATRWRVGTAPAARDRFGLIVRARWQLMLERCRNGRAGEWLVEYDHVAHRFSLAATLADPTLSRRAGEKAIERIHQA